MRHFLKVLLMASLALQAADLSGQKKKKSNKNNALAELLAEANAQADVRTAEIADEFNITTPQEKNKIKQACRKYYRGLAQLERKHSSRHSGNYQKQHERIVKAYYLALRKVLPQS